MNAQTYPAGWGWHPKVRLGGPTPDDLPELPMLRLIRDTRKRNDAIIEAIDSVPGLRQVIKPKHLRERYGLNSCQAWDLLNRRVQCDT